MAVVLSQSSMVEVAVFIWSVCCYTVLSKCFNLILNSKLSLILLCQAKNQTCKNAFLCKVVLGFTTLSIESLVL